MAGAGNTDWLGLRGKTCVVTGAASGIGRGIAEGLAGAGANLALLDVNMKGLGETAGAVKASGVKTLAVECDTSSQTSVLAAAARVEKELGPADVLVNNAGILRPGPLESLSLDLWNQLISINLTGYFLCAQAFGKQMLARKKGAMVHIASIAGKMPQTFSGAYSVSKAGVIMLSRQIAAEWGRDGIRSNAVCPGTIRTPLSEAFYQVPGVVEAREKIIPMHRIGTAKDIADAVVYLASDRSTYISGEDVLVDGGLEKMIMDILPRPGHEAPKRG
jgi:NAD(P)-dependent dehydrogenase (short-subunit alcohol dehydrogenase family)